MATINLNKDLAHELKGPFNTFCDDIDDLKDQWAEFQDNKPDIEELAYKKEEKLNNKAEKAYDKKTDAYNDLEEFSGDVDDWSEETTKKYNELEDKTWDEYQQKLEENQNIALDWAKAQIPDDIIDQENKLYRKLLLETIHRFMADQGIEITDGEADWLAGFWESVFVIDK